MLYRHGDIFRSILIASDLSLVAASWVAAYGLRFHTGIPAPLGVPPFREYLWPLAVILPVWFVLFRSRGLYEPQRLGSLLGEASRVVRASLVGIGVLLAAVFFVRSFSYSRAAVVLFSALSVSSVLSFRVLLRLGLRQARRRGYNLRYALVVGAGPLVEQVISRIRKHPEAGLVVRAVLSDDVGVEREIEGVPVTGRVGDLKATLASDRVDQVILAIPREQSATLEKALADLEDELVNVKLVPDLLGVITVGAAVETLDGLPMIGLRESPLVGWAAVQKRAFDLAAAGLGLLLLSPALVLIAAAVKRADGGPVLFRQQRMGLDGRVFSMLKFRTMRSDAERESGPVFALPDDRRRTGVGAWLRRHSLDELPQLWNVLRGDMSVVGPRPERPHFIESFRSEIPGYVLRHTVKAGITGWAQVHGWRGQTSLHERIEHDIYYIQNWSLELDLRILALTLVRGLRDDNAY